jgi:hypothetical protein
MTPLLPLTAREDIFARMEGFQNSQILGDYEHLGVGPPCTLTRRTADLAYARASLHGASRWNASVTSSRADGEETYGLRETRREWAHYRIGLAYPIEARGRQWLHIARDRVPSGR